MGRLSARRDLDGENLDPAWAQILVQEIRADAVRNIHGDANEALFATDIQVT